MTVTEVKQSLGSWNLRLSEQTPKEIIRRITFFGHIAIVPGRMDPQEYGDNLLKAARYVGVFRGRDAQDSFTLKGSGMAFWLGDEDDKGDVFETAVVLTGETFPDSINALLPPSGAVTAGTISSAPGLYTGRHQWQTPRQAITYVADTFNAEFRVNGDGTLDAGTVSDLYGTTPRALLLRKDFGSDLLQKALAGKMGMGVDVEDTTTRVVLLGEGEGSSISTGDADAPPTPYRDLHGNPIRMTRIVSESATSTGNAAARAQLQLNRFLNPRRAVNLSSTEYDVKGTFEVGEYLDVYDPDSGFYDQARETFWKGERINPMALRCVELTWPIPAGWTVAFRTITGEWIDLSAYYIGEAGETTIVVGELARGMSSVGGEAVGIRPNLPDSPDPEADTTIPGEVTFGDFTAGSYQSETSEWTKSAILAMWAQPLNADGSTITDGDHYELRYRVNTFIGYQVRWGQLTGYRWGALGGNRWGAPISSPITAGDWQSIYAPWGSTDFMVMELTPGVEYEFQIRAVDRATHQGVWSDSKFVITIGDLFAPSIPAPPVAFGSMVAVQISHNLGRSTGGTFNLEPDLAYLSVHAGGSSTFVADDNNELGKLQADGGMVQAGIPAVATFPLENIGQIWVRVRAVDRSGNMSGQSDAVAVTPGLIDDAHISSLTVSKVTAGTVSATWLLGDRIATAWDGRRVQMSQEGIEAWDDGGFRTVYLNPNEGRIEFQEPGYYYPPVEVGMTRAGTAGLLVSDLFGNTKALIGQLRNTGGFVTENYGIALVDPSTGALVKLSDYIFGPKKTAKDSIGENTGAAFAWGNLDDGEGPVVNSVTVGPLGRVFVTLTAYMEPDSGSTNLMGVEVRNAVTNAIVRAPAQLDSLSIGGGNSVDFVAVQGRASAVVWIDGLPAGSYKFTAKYMYLLGTGFYANRQMIVQPY